MSKKITITCCRECPHLKITRAPYTGDSFDMIDEDAGCTLAKKSLAVSERPWQLERILKGPIPKWCPL